MSSIAVVDVSANERRDNDISLVPFCAEKNPAAVAQGQLRTRLSLPRSERVHCDGHFLAFGEKIPPSCPNTHQ